MAVSVSDALNGDSKQLSSLKHEYDEGTALDVLKIFITSMVEAFNVGKTMSESQIDDACLLIMEDFWHLKVADLQVFVKQAKKGHFGKLYDRIDCQVIIEWLSAYDEERMAIAARQRPKAIDLPEPSLPRLQMPDGEQIPVKLYEKVKQPVEVKPLPVNTDPVYQMHQRWHRQFDELWKKQGYLKGRLVKKYGKIKNPRYGVNKSEPAKISRKLSVSEYVEYKQWQYEQYLIRKNINN